MHDDSWLPRIAQETVGKPRDVDGSCLFYIYMEFSGTCISVAVLETRLLLWVSFHPCAKYSKYRKLWESYFRTWYSHVPMLLFLRWLQASLADLSSVRAQVNSISSSHAATTKECGLWSLWFRRNLAMGKGRRFRRNGCCFRRKQQLMCFLICALNRVRILMAPKSQF